MSVLKEIPKITGIFILCLMTACQQDNENIQKKSILPNQSSGLTFLIHPYDTPSRLMARFQPLCDYLSKHIGQTVHLQLASSYVDQIKRISNGDVDLAYMGPTPFLRAQDHYLGNENQLIPIVAETSNGKASYRSVIVVSTKSEINTLSELKNQSIAFGAPHSFSSHYVPRTLLASAGLGLANLRDYAFLGRHERVALAVLHGDFDAGGLRKTVANNYTNRSPGLKIISTSEPLPPHLIVARAGLQNNLIIQIRKALLSPGKDFNTVTLALGNDINFVFPELSLFKNARKVIEAVEALTKVPKQ